MIKEICEILAYLPREHLFKGVDYIIIPMPSTKSGILKRRIDGGTDVIENIFKNV